MSTLFDVVAAYADSQPEALALISEDDGTRTYRELVDRSGALAAVLHTSLGLKPQDRVCLWMVNHPAWVEAYLAASAGGYASVAANPEWTDDEIAFILEHSDVSAVICDSRLAGRITALQSRVPGVRHVVAVSFDGVPAPAGTIDYEALLAEAPRDARHALPEIDATTPAAHIMYTSGTTAGRPKAVVGHITGSGGTDYTEMFGLVPNDRAIVMTPFFHGNGMGGMMSAIAYGASVVFPRRFSASRFWRLVDLYRPTYLYTLSPLVNILLGRPEGPHERRHNLRVAIVLGSAQNAAVIERRFGVPVIDWYGMTEAGSGTYTRLDEPRRPGSAGRRFPGSTMTIIRDDGTEADPGEVGEVVFRRGTIMFDGYLKDDEATKAVIDTSYFHTGDLGYFDADGYFYFVDRKKDIVRRGGENMSSMEIETVMRSFPGVADAAIVGKPDPVLGERVVAFVIPGEEGPPDVAALQSYMGEHLAHFKVPEEVFFVDQFPRTPTNKIIKKQLRERLASSDEPGASEPALKP